MLQNSNDRFMQAEDIAEALGLGRAAFLRKRNSLIINHGMPAPLPGQKNLRWYRDSMEKWLRQYGELKAHAMRSAGSLVRIHVDRAQLTAVYAAGAAA
jgi:predicted DNA-binding transcriptional regulator AlpA